MGTSAACPKVAGRPIQFRRHFVLQPSRQPRRCRVDRSASPGPLCRGVADGGPSAIGASGRIGGRREEKGGEEEEDAGRPAPMHCATVCLCWSSAGGGNCSRKWHDRGGAPWFPCTGLSCVCCVPDTRADTRVYRVCRGVVATLHGVIIPSDNTREILAVVLGVTGLLQLFIWCG
jgi:hypothetical protein